MNVTQTYAGGSQNIAWHHFEDADLETMTTVPSLGGTFVKGEGLFWPNSKVQIREICDGTSNTVHVGERRGDLGNNPAGRPSFDL